MASQALDGGINLLADVMYRHTDASAGAVSYLDGGYGKFRDADDNQVVLSQASLSLRPRWGNFSGLLVLHGYADGVKDAAGISEAYLQYKSLPSTHGYRGQLKAGLLYPSVSMTNLQVGWTSPYTLNYSAINGWIGEELRHRGLEASITRLGKFSGSEHDLELALALFEGNDPAGAVLSWHGWNHTNRITLRHESLDLPNSHIGFVPGSSDVFLELDERVGYHLNARWKWGGRARILAGYYDNRGDPTVVRNLQWAWDTRFRHLGVSVAVSGSVRLIGQWLAGSTLMQSSSGLVDLVDNDYDSAFLMLTRQLGPHRVSLRLENFAVKDRDNIAIDNNEEDGRSFTFNYNYRLNRHLFLHAELDWIDSERPAREFSGAEERMIERQLQFGLRWYH